MGIINKLKTTRAKRVPKELVVISAVHLTPNMRRVTLGGDALESFPEGSEGAIIKLIFKQAGSAKPPMRTYTISRQRLTTNQIDIDFMLHASESAPTLGIAAPWSLSTRPGDRVSVFGPGPAKFINLDADCFLLAADMTALPALTANLNSLPSTAKGKAFIEILSEADKQNLTAPESVEIIWVVNDSPGSDASSLYHAIAEADWQEGKLAAWVACEFKTMKKIRNYLKVDRSLDKSHIYISSYWKKGDTEEQHKVLKQADSIS